MSEKSAGKQNGLKASDSVGTGVKFPTGSSGLCRAGLQLESVKPDLVLSEAGVESTVVVFGSARIMDSDQLKAHISELESELKKNPYDGKIKEKLRTAEKMKNSVRFYDIAREFAEIAASEEIRPGKKLIVVTGGGPGIMEAANRGACEAGARNAGLTIAITHEQKPNPYITPELCFRFKYFATRKMVFVSNARAFVVFPGGFGTMDELFEVLALVQTAQKKRIPLILACSRFWHDVINFPAFAKWGYIAEEDLNLFRFADTAREIWDYIKDFYKDKDIPANAVQ